MVTQRDIAFLRTLVRQGRLEREPALRCYDHLIQRAHQGRPQRVEAALQELGLLAPEAARPESEVFVHLGDADPNLSGFEIGPQEARDRLGSRYRGRYRGTPVSVLALHPAFADFPALLAEIESDLRGWTGFRHPLAVPTLAVGFSHGRTVVVTARPPGRSLRDVLREQRNGRFPPPRAGEVVRDIAMVLAGAHEAGLAVGDIRPEAVALDGDRAKLIQLGLSRAACISEGFGKFGLTHGHVDYLAPEVLQAGGGGPSRAADIYALGILFYELVTGRVPFSGNPLEILEQHFQAPLAPPPQGVLLNRQLGQTILRMTAKAPGSRPDARSLIQVLPTRKRQLPADWRSVSVESGHGKISEKWSAERILQAPVVAEPLDEPADSQRAPFQQPPREPLVDLGEKLGRGPVGFCYTASARDFPGQALAVKVLSRKFAKKPQIHARILADLRAATRVRHPFAIAPLDVLEISNRDLVLYERTAGETLRQRLTAEGRLGETEALKMLKELGQALLAAELVEQAHGDVRPEKIYLRQGHPARLADFGQAEASCLAAGYGRYGICFGHPAYLAPEVIQEGRTRPSIESDIYALGIVLYECLAGQAPFQEESTRKLLLQHLQQELPAPPGDVSRPVAALLLRMTSKDPERRHQSASELLEGLDRCEEDLLQQPEPAPQAGKGEEQRLGDGTADFEIDYESFTSDVWDQEALLLSRPDFGWDKDRIKASDVAVAIPEVAELQPDEDSEPLYDMLGSQELNLRSREEVLEELGIDPQEAGQAYNAERSQDKRVDSPTPMFHDMGRSGSELVLRNQPDMGNRSLGRRRKSSPWRTLRLALFWLVFFGGMTGGLSSLTDLELWITIPAGFGFAVVGTWIVSGVR